MSLLETYIRFIKFIRDEIVPIVPKEYEREFYETISWLTIGNPSEAMIRLAIILIIKPQFESDRGKSLIEDWRQKFGIHLTEFQKNKLELFMEYFSSLV